jgi:hypothetical protein
MQWSEIRQQYPDAFILLSDLVEEKISATRSRIVAGTVVQVSPDAKAIRAAYQQCQRLGQHVIYALPTTPAEFIVEDVPLMGRLA